MYQKAHSAWIFLSATNANRVYSTLESIYTRLHQMKIDCMPNTMQIFLRLCVPCNKRISTVFFWICINIRYFDVCIKWRLLQCLDFVSRNEFYLKLIRMTAQLGNAEKKFINLRVFFVSFIWGHERVPSKWLRKSIKFEIKFIVKQDRLMSKLSRFPYVSFQPKCLYSSFSCL